MLKTLSHFYFILLLTLFSFGQTPCHAAYEDEAFVNDGDSFYLNFFDNHDLELDYIDYIDNLLKRTLKGAKPLLFTVGLFHGFHNYYNAPRFSNIFFNITYFLIQHFFAKSYWSGYHHQVLTLSFIESFSRLYFWSIFSKEALLSYFLPYFSIGVAAGRGMRYGIEMFNETEANTPHSIYSSKHVLIYFSKDHTSETILTHFHNFCLDNPNLHLDIKEITFKGDNVKINDEILDFLKEKFPELVKLDLGNDQKFIYRKEKDKIFYDRFNVSSITSLIQKMHANANKHKSVSPLMNVPIINFGFEGQYTPALLIYLKNSLCKDKLCSLHFNTWNSQPFVFSRAVNK